MRAMVVVSKFDGPAGGGDVPKCLAVLLALSLGGCAGAPLVSSGLSAEPSSGPVADYIDAAPAASPRAPRRRVAVERVKAPAVVTTTGNPETTGDDTADRAARDLDRDVQRLEKAAKQATTSICRGC